MSALLAMCIPLPPLEEQRRIVERVHGLSSRVHQTDRLRADISRETAVLLSASDICSLAAKVSTKTARLEQLCERITKGESPEWQGFTYQDSGPLFIRSENVLWGRIDLSKQIHIPLEFHQKLNRSQLIPGDVLINLVGASIGRACRVPQDLGDANVNQAVAVIRPIAELIDCDYLLQFLLSRSIQRVIHGGKVETARPNISLGDLRNLAVPLPAIEEQKHLARMVTDHRSVIEQLLKHQAELAAETRRLMPSILNQAFSGQL